MVELVAKKKKTKQEFKEANNARKKLVKTRARGASSFGLVSKQKGVFVAWNRCSTSWSCVARVGQECCSERYGSVCSHNAD